MAKRKAAPEDDAAATSPSRAGAKPPDGSVYIGQSIKPESIPEFIWLRLANRHGLITGATGTGKTVTLQGLAEGFSDAGVPVFCADVKGDLSGVAEAGEPKPWIEARDKEIGYTQDYRAYPGDFLGPVRRARPAHPHDRFRDGPAAAVSPHGSERRARRRAQYRLQNRRRRKASAIDAGKFADPARGACRARRHAHHEIRQRHQSLGRLDPAFAARARPARRGAFLRQARRSTSRTSC